MGCGSICTINGVWWWGGAAKYFGLPRQVMLLVLNFEVLRLWTPLMVLWGFLLITALGEMQSLSQAYLIWRVFRKCILFTQCEHFFITHIYSPHEMYKSKCEEEKFSRYMVQSTGNNGGTGNWQSGDQFQEKRDSPMRFQISEYDKRTLSISRILPLHLFSNVSQAFLTIRRCW